MFKHQYLIIARSSALRQKLFEKLALQELRLDAVGSAKSAEKRLAKDRYDLVLLQEDFEGLELDPSKVEIFTIKESDLDRLDDVVNEIVQRVQSLREKK